MGLASLVALVLTFLAIAAASAGIVVRLVRDPR
jgi:hypothetical protein